MFFVFPFPPWAVDLMAITAQAGTPGQRRDRYIAVLIGSWDPASVWVDVVIIVLQILLLLKQQMDDPTKIWEVGDG